MYQHLIITFEKMMLTKWNRVILIVVDFWKQQNKAKSIDDNTIVYNGRLVHNLFLCVNKRTKQKI